MEIKVGEYVRTKSKGIKKIDHLSANPNVTVNKYRPTCKYVIEPFEERRLCL